MNHFYVLMSLRRYGWAVAQLLFVLWSGLAQAQTFNDELVVGNWNGATGMTFDANGRLFVWEKAGRVYVVDNGQKRLFLDISEEVGNFHDYGLLGFCLDPKFFQNGHVYLSYVVDRHHLLKFGTAAYSATTDQYYNATIGRITRYTAKAGTNLTEADPSSRKILLGETRKTGVPILHLSHGPGSLVFGSDGSLLASFGDAASFYDTDTGSKADTYFAQARTDSIILDDENIGAYRSQYLNSHNGKILRLDPNSGDGLPSNPYYDPTKPRSPKSRVYAVGLRNPFRVAFKPGSGSHYVADGNPGVLFVGDVGYNTREELNVVTAKGQNFGWPKFEGIDHQPGWNNLGQLAPDFNAALRRPAFDYRTGNARAWVDGTIKTIGTGTGDVPGPVFQGQASLGGCWYTGTSFPAEYHNTYLHTDYAAGWIRSVQFDDQFRVLAVRDVKLGLGFITCLTMGPDGEVYYVRYTATGQSEIRRLRWGGNRPPVAVASADRLSGGSPLTVQFRGDQSSDPEGQALQVEWDFGDGSPKVTTANPSYTFTATGPKAFNVTLRARDAVSQTHTTTLTVSVNNTAPVIRSTSLDNLGTFANTGLLTVPLTATVEDTEHTPEQLSYEWQVVLHHDDHTHPEPVNSNVSTQAVLAPLPCDGHVYFYRITLKVTDAAGLSATFRKDVYPNCTNVDSQPPTTPSNLTTSELAYNALTLSWSASTDNVGVVGYDVYLNGQLLGSTSGTTYALGNVTASTPYRFNVVARDAAGNRSVTSVNFVVTTPAVPPGTCVPATSHLSDLAYQVVSNAWGPVEKDRSNGEQGATDGRTLTLNGKTYAKGLGVHGPSEIVYNLGGTWTRFKAEIGIDDEVTNPVASVVFEVWADGQRLFQSGTLRTSSATVPVDVDVTGRQQLRLLVTDAGDGANSDHADWADARLERVCGTQPTPTPTPDTQAPTAPGNLASSNVTQTGLTLTWSAATDNIGVTGYEIYQGATRLGETTSPTFNVSGLTASTSYGFSVKAKDAAGNVSPASATLSVTTTAPAPTADTQAPTAPTNVVSSNVTQTSLTLSWSASSDNVGVTAYDVFRGTDKIGESTATSFNVTGLTAGTSYGFSVKARDAAGNSSPASSALNVTTPSGSTSPPGCQPTTTYLSDLAYQVVSNAWGPVEKDRSNGEQGATDGRTLTLNGKTYAKGLGVHAASEITYNLGGASTRFRADVGVDDEVPDQAAASVVFEVWADGQRLFQSPTLRPTSATVPVDVDVTGRQQLRLLVKDAGDGNGYDHADWADARLIRECGTQPTPTPDTQAPTAPTNVVSSNVTQTSLTLSWSASSDNVGVTAYDVFRGTDKIGESTATSFNVTGLTAGTSYGFSVKARDAAGNSSPASSALNVTTLPAATGSAGGTGLRAEYFNNRLLTAPAALTRLDGPVDFDWGNNAPASSVNADNFSVRWTGQLEAPVTGSYTFATTTDDGVRLWVNGQLLINNWTDHGPTTDQATVSLPLTAGQRYDVRLEFYENGGGAVAKLLWAYPGQARQPIPQARLFPDAPTLPGGGGTGLRAEYFNNRLLTAPAALTRLDGPVDFDWGNNAPASSVNADNFSVRWTGQLEAPVTGSYTFATTTDDGVRLWVNGQLLINNWTDHGPTTDQATVSLPLTAGQRYDVRLEFYENGGGAVAKLLWAYPGQARQPIPQARLFPPGSSNNRLSSQATARTEAESNGFEGAVDGPESETTWRLHPNPARDETTVDLRSAYRGRVVLELVDLLGRTLRTEAFEKTTPYAAHALSLRGLVEGVYLLRVQQGALRQTSRLVVRP
jgi:chitodextrinase/glucose/arabinose dehydrogenase